MGVGSLYLPPKDLDGYWIQTNAASGRTANETYTFFGTKISWISEVKMM